MAKRIIIKYKENKENEEYEQDDKFDFLQDIFSVYIEGNNIKVKRGDLVRMVPIYSDEDKEEKDKEYQEYDEMDEDTKVEINFYRNEYMYIINGEENDYFLQELDFDIDPYGSLPKNFVLYQEPDYFTQKHWIRNNYPMFGHANYLWLEPTIEMVKNLKTTKDKNNNLYIVTKFIDVRNNPHKIFFDFCDKTTYSNIKDRKKMVVNIMKEKMCVELNRFDKNDSKIKIFMN